MRTLSVLLLTLVLAATALAGCTMPDATPSPTTTPETTPEVTPEPTSEVTPTPDVTPTPEVTPTPPALPVLDSSTYTLTAAGFPGQALPGTKINFTLQVNGTLEHESDHIGAHYADNDTTVPPADGRTDCEHTISTLPGSFLVNCTFQDEGTWHVFGHARINESGELHNWWAATPFVVKVRDYNLTTSDVPTNSPTSGANFTFKLNITGMDNATTEHLGAHFWNATNSAPTAANSMGACAHTGDVGSVGVFTVTCAIDNAGLTPKDFFVRGHLRLTEGGTTLDWWSPEFKVSVLGIPASPI